MRTLNQTLLIAAAGRDAEAVRRAGLQCLHLCAALSESGQFSVLSHPLCAAGDLIGIVDRGGLPSSPAAFAASACRLAQTRRAAGILIDFQREELADCAAALDEQTAQAGLSLWVPRELTSHTPHAVCIAETGISGGSLTAYFAELSDQYGGRVAAQLVRSCARFSIPSRSVCGTPLTLEQAMRLSEETGASVFFSRELCAKYFTYMHHGSAYFVLFDDDDTIRKKQEVLSAAGISRQLLLYPDAAVLGVLNRSKKAPQ